MSRLFVAINGDDVGSKFGRSIMSDDHNLLMNHSQQFKQAHDQISKFIEDCGGRVIVQHGDECIYEIPEDQAGCLEQVRSDYHSITGHTLSIGVGATVSEAYKAVIYGKLNGKDQIVEYTPQIDDYISQGDDELDQEDMPKEDEQQGDVVEGDKRLDNQGVEGEKNAPTKETQDEGGGKAESNEDDSAEESDDEDSDSDDLEGEESSSEEPVDEKPVHGDNSQSPASSNPTESKDTVEPQTDNAIDGEESEEKPQEGDMKKPMISDKKAPQEKVVGKPAEMNLDPEQDSNTIPEDDSSDQEDIGEGDEEEVDDEMGDGDIQELSDEDLAQPQAGDEDKYNELMQMFQAHLQDEGAHPQGAEDPTAQGIDSLDPEMNGDVEVQSTEELKQNIAESLMVFKENKEVLEQLQVDNPQLYESLISMLRTMIDMGRQLSMAPEADGMQQDQVAPEQMQEEIPAKEQDKEEEVSPEEKQDFPPKKDDKKPFPPKKDEAQDKADKKTFPPKKENSEVKKNPKK